MEGRLAPDEELLYVVGRDVTRGRADEERLQTARDALEESRDALLLAGEQSGMAAPVIVARHR